MTEDEMVGWHHQFSGHELGQPQGNGAPLMTSAHLMTEQQPQLPLWLILSYQYGVTECQVEKRCK